MLAYALTLPAHADEAEAPPPPWGAVDATYTISVPTEGPLRLTLTWRFAAVRPGWWEAPLVGPGLVVGAISGPAMTAPDGLHALLPPGSTTTITVTGTLDPASAGHAALAILPAARQHVIVDAPGLDVTVTGATDGWLAASPTLALDWRPHVDTAPAPARPLVHAEVATAVWAEPGALLSRSVARWKVLRGEVSAFELDVAGLEDVEVEGPNLAGAERAGDRMTLRAKEPVRGGFTVTVKARRALPGDEDVPAPAPRPVATRVERWWTVGRAEDGELVPTGGPRSVPARALPEWARGLSDTPPESYWRGDAPLGVRVARYAPLMGPDTVIERATLVVAAAVEGRALARTTWDVRNERRQYLHVRPAPGTRPVTARVSGEPVLVLSDGEGGIYVPLEKSVETVQGLLTFPVELTWIVEGEGWERKGERTFALPSVDAPIQAAEWEVYLPRGVTSKEATAAVEPPPVEEAGSEELQRAVDAYKNNDFQEAQGWLDAARSSGSTSSNVGRLQSNLDVLLEKDAKADEADDAATRRVRDLANAKTVTMQVEQEKKEEAARKAYQSGDVDEAERYLEEVIALSEDIGVTEQKESAEQSGKRESAEAMLADVKKQKAKKAPAEPKKPAERQDSDHDGAVDALDEDESEEGGEVGGTFMSLAGAVATGDAQPTPDTTSSTTKLPAAEPAAPKEPPAQSGAATNENTYVVDGDDEEEPSDTSRIYATETAETLRVVQTLPGVSRAKGHKSGGKADKAKASPAATTPPPPAPPPPPKDIRYREDTTVDFDGLDVTGELAGGEAPAFAPAGQEAPVVEEKPPAFGEDLPVEFDQPAPRAEPERRAALQVEAAPLTLALPLGDAVVRSTAALLPAGATPTLTVPYRTRPGADR